ncbi:MAG: hypothetical protein PVH88_26060 [Ignavibacteria bacterium]
MEYDTKFSKEKNNKTANKSFDEVRYIAGNIGISLLSIFNFLFRIKYKIVGFLMLVCPVYFFDEGRLLVMELVESIKNNGLFDILILFTFVAVAIVWCTIAIRFLVKS